MTLTLDELPGDIRQALGDVQRLRPLPQGMTSTVAVADTPSGARVIKRARGTLYGGWLAKEHRVLSALATTVLPTPRPYAFARRDTGVAPERWLVMDFLPGQPLATMLDAERDVAKRAALLRVFGQTLATIHAALVPAGIQEPGPTWLAYMLDEAAENLEHFNVDGTPELLARLRAAPPQPVAATLIHGDYTLDNVLVEAGRVTGVIDWSGGAIGDPRYDLALATRPQREAFSEQRDAELQAFYEGYERAPLAQDEFDYFKGLYEFF